MTPKEGETTRDRVTKKESGMIELGVTKYDRLCALPDGHSKLPSERT